uniref:MIF4G domain-containing protein n=1 Tax=Bubo bubo TaxID=30461 RepID=A0A8C0EU05_BUBBB
MCPHIRQFLRKAVNKIFSDHVQHAGISSGSQEEVSVPDSGQEMAEPQVAVAPVVTSRLSVKAPEFYPSGYNQNFNQNFTVNRYDGYLTLAEYVQDFLNHLTEQPGCFEMEIEQFAETLNGWVTADEALQELVELIYQQATSVPNFSYMGARLCNYLSHHLTISPQSGNFRQLLLQRSVSVCHFKSDFLRLHAFLFHKPNILLSTKHCNFCSASLYFRDVKHMLLKLVELRSSNWGRVHGTSPRTEATPENDPNYFMNEPTFYTSDGVPFTAADPDYQEKYQELLEREDLFPEYEENGTDLSGPGDLYFDDIDDEMDPEIEEAYEKFCLESEHKRKQ